MLGRDRKKNKKYLSIVSNGGEAAINAKSRAKSISGYPCALFPLRLANAMSTQRVFAYKSRLQMLT